MPAVIEGEFFLKLTLSGPDGKDIELKHHELMALLPPEVVGKREFWGRGLEQAAHRLGKNLAQLLADKEGWHGADRADNLTGFGQDGPIRL